VSRSTHVNSPASPSRPAEHSPGGRWRRALLGAGAAALLAIGALSAACSTASAARSGSTRLASPSPTPAARPRPPERLPVGTIGRYSVAEQTLRLVDRSRVRLGPRALPTTVWYPVIPAAAAASGRLARGLFPLVVFAPGFAQCGGSYGSLLRTWATAGYVVAAVDFPRTNCHLAHPDENDLVHQPADMAYVIRQLLAVSGQSRGLLAGLVDPGKIAAAGQSDGGDTVAALAANTCCRDRAITAAIVLAGAEWPPLGGSYFTQATPPILFVQGDADSINPPAASMMMYQADRTGPRFYLDLFGADHLAPYEGQGPPEPVVARVTVDFLDRYLAGSPGAAAAMQRDGDVAGVATLVSGSRLPP
jgi:dienelactone hydrolase